MAPGALHCAAAARPNSFDTLSALENWSSTALRPRDHRTKYVNDNPAQGVARTIHVQVSRESQINGVGNSRDAVNWTCPPRDRRCGSRAEWDQAGSALKIAAIET